MSLQKVIILSFALCVSSCAPHVDAWEESEKTQTTVTQTTDEIGNDILIITQKRDEGYTVHPSVQMIETAHEFFCEGHKLEISIVRRHENQEMRSVDFTLKSNGEEIDLKPIFDTPPNLFGYHNVDTQFACVDDITRMIISGQAETENNKLTSPTAIIDILIDRKTGIITPK